MDWERDISEFSIDGREQRLTSDMRLVAMLMARVLDDLEWCDSAQVFNADGMRNLSDWVAQKLDVSSETAKTLVRTMRRTANKPHLRQALAEGSVSFDRVEALSRIEDEKDLLEHLDISGVRRTAADRIEIDPDDEVKSAEDQYLVMQPNLDESWWRVHGGLDGLTGAVVDKTLAQRADRLPDLPDGTKGSAGWRRAMALYELASGGQSPKAQITVFVDADQAVPSDGKAGVRLEAGPKVGQRALEAVLCGSVTEVTVNSADGVPMRYGRSSQTNPPALRRAALATTGGYCGIDGCNSRYRVEVHHKTPYSEGGRTDPENLIPLCWFHHQIAVHQQGFELFQHPQHGRWRLQKYRDFRPHQSRELVGASPGIRPQG